MSRIPDRLRRIIRQQAGDRCGYCLAHQTHVLGIMEVDHIIPVAYGGPTVEQNLWLACGLCNRFKRDQYQSIDPETGVLTALFNPRTQLWNEHFRWSADGASAIGLTPCGRATVVALQLNNLVALHVRKSWVTVGWHPPK
jgi:hypothetical protein